MSSYSSLLDFTEFVQAKRYFRQRFILLGFVGIAVFAIALHPATPFLFVGWVISLFFMNPARRADRAMMEHFATLYEGNILDFRNDFDTIRSFDDYVGSFIMRCIRTVRERQLLERMR